MVDKSRTHARTHIHASLVPRLLVLSAHQEPGYEATYTHAHSHKHTHIPLSIWLPFPGVQQLQDGVYLRVAAVLESNLNPNPTGADRGEVVVVGDRMREVILDQVVGRGGMRRTRLEERDGPSLIEQHNTRTASSLGLAFPRPRPAFCHSVCKSEAKLGLHLKRYTVCRCQVCHKETVTSSFILWLGTRAPKNLKKHSTVK